MYASKILYRMMKRAERAFWDRWRRERRDDDLLLLLLGAWRWWVSLCDGDVVMIGRGVWVVQSPSLLLNYFVVCFVLSENSGRNICDTGILILILHESKMNDCISWQSIQSRTGSCVVPMRIVFELKVLVCSSKFIVHSELEWQGVGPYHQSRNLLLNGNCCGRRDGDPLSANSSTWYSSLFTYGW